jgi:hypothetical protein
VSPGYRADTTATAAFASIGSQNPRAARLERHDCMRLLTGRLLGDYRLVISFRDSADVEHVWVSGDA